VGPELCRLGSVLYECYDAWMRSYLNHPESAEVVYVLESQTNQLERATETFRLFWNRSGCPMHEVERALAPLERVLTETQDKVATYSAQQKPVAGIGERRRRDSPDEDSSHGFYVPGD